MLDDLARKAAELEQGGTFLGGPRRVFARVGCNQLIVLLDNGLTPDCKVLDIGCGCLRGGYWLINFLGRGGYHGIEPNEAMRESGMATLIAPELLRSKAPRFSATPDFDLGVFGTRLDFVVARSVWTHAAPHQIGTMLDGFVAHTTPGAAFLTSYIEADPGEQYAGAAWVGRSHESQEAGFVYYHLAWIEEVCAARGLVVQSLYAENGQTWLRIERRESVSPGSDTWTGSRIAGFTLREGGKEELRGRIDRPSHPRS